MQHVSNVVNLKQGTAEWKDWRRNGITATEAACAMGVSGWGTALSVYKNKLNPKDTETTPYQEWGTILEPHIRQKFAQMHPEFMVVPGECYENIAKPWMRCSLDGECYNADGNAAILECKTGRTSSKWDPVPADYYAQVQWQMHVTGYRKVFFAVLINGYDYFEREVDYDPEYAAKLEDKCFALWQNICNKIEPVVDVSHAEIDQAIINEEARTAEDKQPEYELDDKSAATYMLLRDAADKATEKFNAFKMELSQKLRKYKRLVYRGNVFGSLVSCQGKVTIDTKALETNYPDVYKAVLKKGSPYAYPKFG